MAVIANNIEGIDRVLDVFGYQGEFGGPNATRRPYYPILQE
jgi:hypothetical protein